MSNSSITRFIVPTTLLLSIASLSISVFQLTRSTPPKVKYVNALRIMKPIFSELEKTLNEMLTPVVKEYQVLNEQIDNLKQKETTKGYLSSVEKKELEEKEKRLKELGQSYNKELEQQRGKMLQGKIAKVNEVIAKIAKKHNCTVQPTQNDYFILLKTVIAKKDDVTDLVLAELGFSGVSNT